MRSVQFKNRDITMAGNLFVPGEFDESGRYPAVVCVHPGGGVKEQTAGEYAKRVAAQGFVTLAFDSSYQGASGGTPHFLDEPMNRVEDVTSAVDYLSTLSFVDPERIGVLGVCAGGGMAVKAATLDPRIKAVGTASAVNVGTATRKGWEGKGKGSRDELVATLEGIAKARKAEAAGGNLVYIPYVPQVGDTSAPRDLQEAAQYYLTPRGQHPNSQNKMLLDGLGAWVGFDAFDLAESLLTQPLQIVAGSEAGSLWHSKELYDRARGPKDFFIVEGATHVDLYDGAGMRKAAGKLSPFFASHL